MTITETTRDEITEITDETVKPQEITEFPTDHHHCGESQKEQDQEQVQEEPEEHVSSEEEFYPADEEVKPKILDREIAVASIQPETETVSEVQITKEVEDVTDHIVEGCSRRTLHK